MDKGQVLRALCEALFAIFKDSWLVPRRFCPKQVPPNIARYSLAAIAVFPCELK